MHTCIHAYMHTCIHAYMYTCNMHVYTCGYTQKEGWPFILYFSFPWLDRPWIIRQDVKQVQERVRIPQMPVKTGPIPQKAQICGFERKDPSFFLKKWSCWMENTWKKQLWNGETNELFGYLKHWIQLWIVATFLRGTFDNIWQLCLFIQPMSTPNLSGVLGESTWHWMCIRHRNPVVWLESEESV